MRSALRLIANDRWFSATAIVALALGIGVNAAGFTLLNAVFLRGLPYEDSGRISMLSWQTGAGRRVNASYAELQDWRAHTRSFDGLAAYNNVTMNISDDLALPEQARGAWLTANAFRVLQAQPLLGRDFVPDDERKGAEPVVIIGQALWRNRYGADPNVLGRPLRVNGQRAAIIGVMPDTMKFPDNTDVWAPFIPTDAQERRDARVLTVFGRLTDRASRRSAEAELAGIAQQLATAYPDTNKDFIRVRVETVTDRFIGGPARTMFLVLMGAVGFVLLIACANVANLLLSRSTQRATEIAVRMALGATRWRVVRQLVLEGIVLGCIGGSIGLLLAAVGVQMFDATVQDPGKPFWIVFAMDYVVFGYVAALCVVTAILFSLAPALHVSRSNNNEVLKEAGRGNAGSRRARWFSGAMVVAELALTVVLLAGAGLMIRSFVNLQFVDIGIDADHLLTMRLQLPQSKYADAEARRAFFDLLEPRLGALAGIDAVAVTTSVPPTRSQERPLEIDGRSFEARPPFVATVTISPRFFEVVGRPLLRGRNFRDSDTTPGPDLAIINERMATRFFPGEDPIGRRIRFVSRDPVLPGQPPPVWRTIVGISPSIRHSSPQDIEPGPVAYLPYRQEPPSSASVLVRSLLPPATVMETVRRAVQAIDRDQPVFTIQTMDQVLEEERWPYRAFGGAFAIFAIIALALSSVGLYAVMAYSVTQRTQEIGIRIAVGAEAREVLWLILKRGLTQLGIGLTLGLAGALALSRLLQRVLVQITPADPMTFVAITILLTAVALAACLLPARRATRVDPVAALRAQ